MSLHTLMFGWEYPPHHLGGLGVACQGLVRGLLKNAVKVTLVLPFSGSEEGVDVRIPAGMDAPIRVPSLLQPYDSFAAYAFRAEDHDLYGPHLAEAVERFTEASVVATRHLSPDIVHSHDWMTFEAGRRSARARGIPMVAHIHATELDRTNFQPDPWIEKRERSGLLAADRVIAVSNYTKGILVRHYGIPEDKIVVVHNSIIRDKTPAKITARRSRQRPPMVLFLGRLAIQKGPMFFLDMAARVHEKSPDVQFVIAGDGPLVGPLLERTLELHLQDNMLFAGRVTSAEASRLYAQADCFVMPSLSEPFGLVALEAAQHGTPVIVSKQSGVSEVLGSAVRVDFWDTEKMAGAVLKILNDKPRKARLRAQASRLLSTLTWEGQAKSIRSLYQCLLT